MTTFTVSHVLSLSLPSTDQGSVSDVTSIVESHDQLSESQGLASESHDLFSEPSRFSEDLPMTYV